MSENFSSALDARSDPVSHRLASKVWPFLLWAGILGAQPTLQITSPADGTVVHPGQTVTVTVSAVGSFAGVIVIGTGGLGASVPLSAPPYQFTMQISARARLGRQYLTASGYVTPGSPIASPSILIDVERSDDPVEVYVEPASLHDPVHDRWHGAQRHGGDLA